MSAGICPSPDANVEALRFLKRHLQHLEDRAMSAGPNNLLVAWDGNRIEYVRELIKAREIGASNAPSQGQQEDPAPDEITSPSVALVGGVIAPAPASVRQEHCDAERSTLNYDVLLEVNVRGVPARAESILCHLVSPDRLPEVLGDFEEGYRLMLARHGFACARRWYRWEVFMVAARGLCDAACKAAKIWSGFGPA